MICLPRFSVSRRSELMTGSLKWTFALSRTPDEPVGDDGRELGIGRLFDTRPLPARAQLDTAKSARLKLKPFDRPDIPLSFAQLRLWFLYVLKI